MPHKKMTILEFWGKYPEDDLDTLPYVSEVREFISDLNAVIRNYQGKPTPVNETLKEMLRRGYCVRDNCANRR